MFTVQQHIDDLLAHIDRVRENARVLAERLIEVGQNNFARVLLARAHVHDASKWSGIEWEQMHMGPDVTGPPLEAAIRQHQKTNDHHPEYWDGLANMPRIAVAELCCDWLARSQEFATDLRVYIKTQAVERFNFASAPEQVKWINTFVDMLLPPKFAPR